MAEFEINKEALLAERAKDHKIEWVKKNTAILVIHGIGNQMPLETLDAFGRGLLQQYRQEFQNEITISHQIVSKPDSSKDFWFDNTLRISKKGSDHFIDLYEYYWANYTEDKSSWKDIDAWTQGVVKGAKKFYMRNAKLGKYYKDRSDFFDSKTGEFKAGRYWFFLSVASKFTLLVDLVLRGLLWLVSIIPLMGSIAEGWVKTYAEGMIRGITNVLGDVVVYNVNDPKSKFYEIKKRIQEGAVKALRYLVENEAPKGGGYYDSILVAGHSLGSQVAYDAINRLNLHTNQALVSGYNSLGNCTRAAGGPPISKLLRGFVTFGCPLDKIIFFLRENVPDDQFLRQQILDHFNGFKQRDISQFNAAPLKDYVNVAAGQSRLLDGILWVNYFDGHDYVSGSLDYYGRLTNINCDFKAGKLSFTHSRYWVSGEFYKDVIASFLNPVKEDA